MKISIVVEDSLAGKILKKEIGNLRDGAVLFVDQATFNSFIDDFYVHTVGDDTSLEKKGGA
jgi:hypothetical protein